MRYFFAIALISLSACLVQPANPPPAGPPPAAPAPGPAPAPSPGGAVLTGMVIDARTHAPINKAAVDVVSNVSHEHFTVETGPDGRYTTHPIMPGDFAVRARAQGYETVNQGVNVGNTEARLDFQLQPTR